MLDEVLVARLHAGAAGAAATLHAVSGDRRALHVATVADRNRDLLVRDQVFQVDFRSLVFNLRPTLVAVLVFDFFQFLYDHAAQFLFRTQDRFVFSDVLPGQIQLFRDFVDGEFGQAVQLQLENGIRLNGGKRPLWIELGRAAGSVDINLFAGKVGD